MFFSRFDEKVTPKKVLVFFSRKQFPTELSYSAKFQPLKFINTFVLGSSLLYINGCFKFQQLLLKMYVLIKMCSFNMFIAVVCAIFLL